MLFICVIFPVYPHSSFTTLYSEKLLEESPGGHIFESVWPFKLIDPATRRHAHPQLHSPASTVWQTRSVQSTEAADSVKPRWTGLKLLTSLLGDVASFSISATEEYFGPTFPATSSSLTLLSSLEVSLRLYCTGSIPWHSVCLTHLPFHYRVWKQLQLSEVCSYFEALW